MDLLVRAITDGCLIKKRLPHCCLSCQLPRPPLDLLILSAKSQLRNVCGLGIQPVTNYSRVTPFRLPNGSTGRLFGKLETGHYIF